MVHCTRCQTELVTFRWRLPDVPDSPSLAEIRAEFARYPANGNRDNEMYRRGLAFAIQALTGSALPGADLRRGIVERYDASRLDGDPGEVRKPLDTV